MTVYYGTNTTEATAAMQIDSTTTGVLIPRMTTTQRDAISSPAESLLIFNTTTNSYNWYDNDNTVWQELDSPTKYITVNAALMIGATTNGAADGQIETTTNAVNLATKDFDQTTDEYASFSFGLPADYNGGTMTAQFMWTSDGGTANQTVEWAIQARAFDDDDLLDQAFGTAVTVTDTLIASGDDIHISSESSAITLAGSPAAGQLAVFRIYRDTSADDLAADARLIAVKLTYTKG